MLVGRVQRPGCVSRKSVSVVMIYIHIAIVLSTVVGCWPKGAVDVKQQPGLMSDHNKDNHESRIRDKGCNRIIKLYRYVVTLG